MSCWSKLLHPAPYVTPQPVWRGDREHPLGNLTGAFENIIYSRPLESPTLNLFFIFSYMPVNRPNPKIRNLCCR